MKAMLITGSRELGGDGLHTAARQRLWQYLADESPDILIHGHCLTGADQLADSWAVGRNSSGGHCHVIRMPAQWDKHGKGAGPRRNEEMANVLKALEACGYDCIVAAFPVGRSLGTRGMMRIARGRNLLVVEPPQSH